MVSTGIKTCFMKQGPRVIKRDRGSGHKFHKTLCKHVRANMSEQYAATFKVYQIEKPEDQCVTSAQKGCN